jgi:hypothetical protein
MAAQAIVAKTVLGAAGQACYISSISKRLTNLLV